MSPRNWMCPTYIGLGYSPYGDLISFRYASRKLFAPSEFRTLNLLPAIAMAYRNIGLTLLVPLLPATIGYQFSSSVCFEPLPLSWTNLPPCGIVPLFTTFMP